MKYIFLSLGIVMIIACALSLLFAFVNMQGYRTLRDGSAEHYKRLRNRTAIYFTVGIVFALVGTACIILFLKL